MVNKKTLYSTTISRIPSPWSHSQKVGNYRSDSLTSAFGTRMSLPTRHPIESHETSQRFPIQEFQHSSHDMITPTHVLFHFGTGPCLQQTYTGNCKNKNWSFEGPPEIWCIVSWSVKNCSSTKHSANGQKIKKLANKKNISAAVSAIDFQPQNLSFKPRGFLVCRSRPKKMSSARSLEV